MLEPVLETGQGLGPPWAVSSAVLGWMLPMGPGSAEGLLLMCGTAQAPLQSLHSYRLYGEKVLLAAAHGGFGVCSVNEFMTSHVCSISVVSSFPAFSLLMLCGST